MCLIVMVVTLKNIGTNEAQNMCISYGMCYKIVFPVHH